MTALHTVCFWPLGFFLSSVIWSGPHSVHCAGIFDAMNVLRDVFELPENPPSHHVDEALRSGIIWVNWDFRRGGRAVQSRSAAQDAMELLAMLGQVDYDEFLDAIGSLWPRAAAVWSRAFGPKRFRLGVRIQTPDMELVSGWFERAFCPDLALMELPAEYRQLRNEWEREVNGQERDIEVPSIPVLISFSELVVDLTRQLFQALQLVTLHTTRKEFNLYKSTWRPLFQLVEIDTMETLERLCLRDLVYISEIASCGVLVKTLPLLGLGLSESTALPFSTALHRLLAAPVASTCVPCESVAINCLGSLRTLDGIFTGVQSSQSLRELICAFDTEPDALGDRVRAWQWIAVAVFSRFSCESLDKFTMATVDLQVRDITTLVQTLQHDNPLSVLFPTARLLYGDLRVTADTFLLANPERQPDSSVVKFNAALPGLRVLDMGETWLSVLLPGWGEAWVQRDKVQLETVNGEKRHRGIRHVIFDYVGNEAMPAILELLHAIGVGLESLTISWLDPEAAIPNDWIREAFRACPNLEDVHIDNVFLESLDVFPRCYNEGCFRAKRLSIVVVRIMHCENAYKLFDFLADKNHAMGKHLRDFSFTYFNYFQLLPNIVTSALQMLRTNIYLCRFEMHVRFSVDNREISSCDHAQIERQFANFDGMPVAVQIAPLPLLSKLSFLSVIRCHPMLRQVDMGVLHHVFSFAAECRKRTVVVRR